MDQKENPLRRWRDERGKSQRELAAMSGVSARAIVYIEGGHTATRANLKKLANALAIPFDELAELEEDKKTRGRQGGMATAAKKHAESGGDAPESRAA